MSIFIDCHELAEKKDIVNPNLLTGTADFSGSNWANINFHGNKLDPLGHKANYSKLNWTQAVQFIPVNINLNYTFSAYIYPTVKQSFIAICRDKKGGSGASNNGTLINNVEVGKWNYVQFTFTGLSSNYVSFDIEVTNGNTDFYAGSYKVEKGDLATSWIPNIQDLALQSDLASIKSDIQALKTKMGGGN